MQTWETTLQSISNRLLLTSIHPSCKSETDKCGNDTGCSDTPVNMDIIAETISTYKVTKWNPTCSDRDNCEEYQWTPHYERYFLWTTTILWVLLVIRLTPEDYVVETEHIECCHTSYECHNPLQSLSFYTRKCITC